MAQVTFSLPSHIQKSFAETYQGMNKNLVLMHLLRDAIEREQRRRRRRQRLEKLLSFGRCG